ncbi:MAG: competence/damage-inducible protein A [Ferruginibacter sp.]|nr:competence/damage-inducible protein A [Ferruginibacter sp.]
MVKASIITIGDELLIGQVIDTNSAWIAKQLNEIGISLIKRVAVGDNRNAIIEALQQAMNDTRVIIITGGLGPTDDDITKSVLTDFFGGPLVVNKAVEDHVKHLFKDVFKKPMPLRNLLQAQVPRSCTTLWNPVGTAPGMQFEKGNCFVFSLPGVPFEMKEMMINSVVPFLANRFKLKPILHRTLLTEGIGESALADLINDLEKNIPKGISLAYLPHFGMVRLRLSANSGIHERILDNHFSILCERVKEYLVTPTDETLPDLVFKKLLSTHRTLSTAESCTGGYIAHKLTQKPGASKIFKGSAVVYSNEAKIKMLRVNPETLNAHGAVSEAVVKELLSGVLQLMNTDYALAISGILGPGGGTSEKPVGTVWMGVSNNQKQVVKKVNLRYNRLQNMEVSCNMVLNMLYKLLKEDNPVAS